MKWHKPLSLLSSFTRNSCVLVVGGIILLACTSPSSIAEKVLKKEGGTPVENSIGGKVPVVYDEKYVISLGGLEKLHPFDIKKYTRIYEQLEDEGWVTEKNLYKPTAYTEEQLKLIHTEAYLKTFEDKEKVGRYLEAPAVAKLISKKKMKEGVIERFKLSSGGTYHHAKPDTGEGFCIIADVPIAIKQLQKDGKIKRALIIDTDAHQGNGTIRCLPNDPSTFTFSIHEEAIYPNPKEEGDWDIGMKGGLGDKEVLKELERALPIMLKKSKPDIIFHVSGCDMLGGDPLSNMNMTEDGIAKRDRMIAEFCKKHKVPYVMTLAGGYKKGAWLSQYKGIVEVMKVTAQ